MNCSGPYAKIMTQSQPSLAHLDPVWTDLRDEAEKASRREPALAGFFYSTLLGHSSLEEALIHRVAQRLKYDDVSDELIRALLRDALDLDPLIPSLIRSDIHAVYERDPACQRMIEPLLYFKGFQALQTHRCAHALWKKGRHDPALLLQSCASRSFQVDIHPAVPIGRGVFIDHATGLVVGETAVIENDVSILHGVTLGGTGKVSGDRHPKIRRGVLIGAGAEILGNIEVGHCSRIAAGSVVLADVPACVTVAGVPARVVGKAPCSEPSHSMNHLLGEGYVADGEGI
jgi:serine O-acetyltransferase